MITITMNETMSGYVELNGTGRREGFDFTIRVSLENRLSEPQPFEGTYRLSETGQSGPVRGYLTLQFSGPRYELDLTLPGVGPVHMAGEKTYDVSRLAFSLTTCPLTVYQQGKPVGYAEVTYREPMWQFPFKALRVSLA